MKIKKGQVLHVKHSRRGQRAENVINLGLSVPLTDHSCLEKSLHVGEEHFYINSAH